MSNVLPPSVVLKYQRINLSSAWTAPGRLIRATNRHNTTVRITVAQAPDLDKSFDVTRSCRSFFGICRVFRHMLLPTRIPDEPESAATSSHIGPTDKREGWRPI
jgi:hypothetical protein